MCFGDFLWAADYPGGMNKPHHRLLTAIPLQYRHQPYYHEHCQLHQKGEHLRNLPTQFIHHQLHSEGHPHHQFRPQLHQSQSQSSGQFQPYNTQQLRVKPQAKQKLSHPAQIEPLPEAPFHHAWTIRWEAAAENYLHRSALLPEFFAMTAILFKCQWPKWVVVAVIVLSSLIRTGEMLLN